MRSANVSHLHEKWWKLRCPNSGADPMAHVLRFHYRVGCLREVVRVSCCVCGVLEEQD
jgi:hypothetical protein